MMRRQRSRGKTFIRDILIVRLGCNHSFGNKLLEVEWQHIQVAQHTDTHTMFLQLVPKERERETRELYGGAENSNKLKEEQEEQEDYSILQSC